MIRRALFLSVFVVAFAPRPFHAAAPIAYRISIPEPQHHWLQVEASFADLAPAPLELRMSVSSPGRYSLHDFAKNVYDVHAIAPDGRELALVRPDASGWTVSEHGSAFTVRYKVFGDRVDGTYLAVDTTHVHMNMPAAIMWARGLDDRSFAITFAQPAGVSRPWTVATQLHGGSSPLSFTAPNLQYLIDSPVEFGPIALRQFNVGGRTFRFAAHHTGTDGELDRFVQDVQRLVREEGAVYGEYPDYEPGSYTFLADYLPYVDVDGMEHRNSTVMTQPSTIRGDRVRLLDTVAHEFFHGWNVERIRPRELEPFDLDRANTTGDLWLAEGFTQYYGPLLLARAGVTNVDGFRQFLASQIDAVLTQPARSFRSAVEMSYMAPFIDAGRPLDRTNWSNTVLSYYTFGAAIALAMDMSLRDRSDGKVTLDDYMRAMWQKHGKPGGAREGYVDRPYTIADAEARLAEVSGDRMFARDFFSRFIEGREAADYTRLLERAGWLVRRRDAGRAWWGDVRMEARGDGGHIVEIASNSPAYAAGLDEDDVVTQVGGDRVSSTEEANAAVSRRKPGDRVNVSYIDRSGAQKTVTVTLAENPHLEIVDAPSQTPAQRTFRDRWLGSQTRP
ncbi:MAG TPA: PDZ domain-containing protein [Vicinamibacterales bacterium]|nr:PDZ domain-containing protein [Vicinamibacterales bacterium]